MFILSVECLHCCTTNNIDSTHKICSFMSVYSSVQAETYSRPPTEHIFTRLSFTPGTYPSKLQLLNCQHITNTTICTAKSRSLSLSPFSRPSLLMNRGSGFPGRGICACRTSSPSSRSHFEPCDAIDLPCAQRERHREAFPPPHFVFSSFFFFLFFCATVPFSTGVLKMASNFTSSSEVVSATRLVQADDGSCWFCVCVCVCVGGGGVVVCFLFLSPSHPRRAKHTSSSHKQKSHPPFMTYIFANVGKGRQNKKHIIPGRRKSMHLYSVSRIKRA